MDSWSFHGGAQSPGILPILLIDRNIFSAKWSSTSILYRQILLHPNRGPLTNSFLSKHHNNVQKRRGEEDQRFHDLQVANASAVILRLRWVVSSTKFQIQLWYCAHNQMQTLRGMMAFANCKCNIRSQWTKQIMKSSCNRQHELWQQQPAQKGESQPQCYSPPT